MLSRFPSALLAVAVTAAGPLVAQGWRGVDAPHAPTRGDKFAMAFDSARGVLVLFGGETDPTSGNVSGEHWEYDGRSWTRRTFNPMPRPRRDHAMAFDSARNVVVLDGGVNGQSSRLGDTWEFDGTAWVLRATAPLNEEFYAHRLVFDVGHGVVVRFGGGSAGGLRSQTHTWDGNTWTLVGNGGPSPREGHVMAYDPVRQRVVLFGGSPGQGNDTWEWDGSVWREFFPAHRPPLRTYAAGTFNPTAGGTIVHGGYASTVLSDTWVWDGTDWSELTLYGVPPELWAHHMVHDAARDVSIMIAQGTPIEHYELDIQNGVPGTFSTFGAGCPGGAGVPVLDAAPHHTPHIGQEFTLEVTNLSRSGFATSLILTGFSRSAWGPWTLPLDLGFVGMPGCSLYVAVASADRFLNRLGSGRYTVTLPYDANLVGQDVYFQSLILELGVNPANMFVSNAGAGHIGRL